MTDHPYYFQQLRIQLQNLLGRVISRNADVVELESIVNSKLKVCDQLSYSTLRRFLGFIPSTTPSPKTLNSLSKALGYRDFSNFCLLHRAHDVWELLDIFNQIELRQCIPSELRTALQFHQDQAYFLSHFTSFLRQLLQQNNFSLLAILFKEKKLFSSYYFDRLRIADTLGQTARQMGAQLDFEALKKLIHQSTTAEEIFLYLFVDYSSFNGYYGTLIHQIQFSQIAKADDRLFITLIINSIYFFRKEPLAAIDSNLNTKGMHPILKGRYHGQLLLMAEDKSSYYDQIFSEARLSDAKQGYFFELLPALIILKDFASIQKVEDLYYEVLLTPANWTFEDKKAFSFIAFSLLAIKKGELKSAQIMLNLINLDKVFASYKSYIELLYCIPKYHMQEQQEYWQSRYLQLAQKLGFTFFSIDYLKSYFEPMQID